MIAEIESAWRETPLTCVKCGLEYVLYSDGKARPQCVTCGRQATDAEIYAALISPTPGELRAEYYANELRNTLRIVREKLARGRTVGNAWRAAALEAENLIIGLQGDA
jgi:hypothetical protein